ncbi:MAG: transglutaminase TgpA family protein [Pseudanabaenaceae cyanobacterium]
MIGTVATPAPTNRWSSEAPEESILLRVLVQLLVFVGIAATDVAASQTFSLWAVPLSAVGAGWAWYARKRRNLLVKFCIAIAMIAMLVVFLNDLVNQVEETRLLLARLLIQLQVLHSFDLPRRKDLGYSSVIGLILLGVAGTIGQTMVFGLWLLLFLAIALPVLVLDYRSRLQLPPRGFAIQQLGLTPAGLLSLFVLVLLLGLGIFLALPRFSGYQLRAFPVSLNVTIQREVAPGTILNPGRPNENTQGNGATRGTVGNGGNGEGQEADEGLLPPLFGEEIQETGQRREPKSRLAMRVRSQAPLFWRVLAYDEYTGKGWRFRESEGRIRTLEQQPNSYEFYIPPALGSAFFSRNNREVIQTYTIVAENFPNLVPTAAVPYRVFFPSRQLDLDDAGGIRAPGALPPELTYTVISSVPMRNVELLRQTSRLYSGAAIARKYLQVPATLRPFLREQSNALFAKAVNPETGEPILFDNAYDATVFLTQALKQTYPVRSLDFDAEAGQDLVQEFFRQGGGQSSHFVSALVLMLRELGIPARFAVGFAPGQFNPFTGFYEVRNTDAMALAEVFFPGVGWLTFDPSPNRPLYPSAVEDNRTFDALREAWRWLMQWVPEGWRAALAALWQQIVNGLGWAIAGLFQLLFGMGWQGFVGGVAMVFGVMVTVWGVLQLGLWGWQRWRWSRLAPPERWYRALLQDLQEQGTAKSPQQTPREYVGSAVQGAPPSQREAALGIVAMYEDWRYGNREVTAVDRLRELWQAWKFSPKGRSPRV